VVGTPRCACVLTLLLGSCYYGDFRQAADGNGDDDGDPDAAFEDATDDDGAAIDAATVDSGGPDAVDATPIDALPIDAGPMTTLRAGLLASWPLDGNGTDASGNALDLQITGLAYAAGKYGQGIQLTASSTGTAKRPMNDATLRLAAGDFTVSAWVNLTDAAASNQFIVTKGFTTGGWGLAESSTIWAGRHGPQAQILSASGSATAGVFRHLVLERQGTALRVYADDVMVASSNTATDIVTPSTEVVEIGSYESATTIRLGGVIDDVAIWNRTLTPAERTFLAANPVPGP
jgi:hypothetical protein